MSTLRELVAAWQAQSSVCKTAFDTAITEINRELDTIGGFATTTPDWNENGKGYCRDYWRQADSFGGGVSVAGEKSGPEDRYKVPCFTEVGDRCFALEQSWRKEAMALTATVYAIREYVAKANGHKVQSNHSDVDTLARSGMGPEHIALALIKEDEQPALPTEPCLHCGVLLAKAKPHGIELRCPSCGGITRVSEAGKGLVERMARRMKVRKLWNRPGADEFAVKLNSQPTYDEVEEARVWIEAMLEEMRQ